MNEQPETPTPMTKADLAEFAGQIVGKVFKWLLAILVILFLIIAALGNMQAKAQPAEPVKVEKPVKAKKVVKAKKAKKAKKACKCECPKPAKKVVEADKIVVDLSHLPYYN